MDNQIAGTNHSEGQIRRINSIEQMDAYLTELQEIARKQYKKLVAEYNQAYTDTYDNYIRIADEFEEIY